jgi:hypothetical protein
MDIRMIYLLCPLIFQQFKKPLLLFI